MTNFFAGYPVIYETDVAWGEMDAFGHVNNIVYFRYFESARLKYFEGTPLMAEMATTGVGPILHSISCRYRLPLTYPDVVQVGVRVVSMGNDRLTMQHRIVSRRQNHIAAEGEGVIVMYDYGRKEKALISPTLRDAIQSLENRAIASLPTTRLTER